MVEAEPTCEVIDARILLPNDAREKFMNKTADITRRDCNRLRHDSDGDAPGFISRRGSRDFSSIRRNAEANR